MNRVSYRENPAKMKSASIRNFFICLVLTLVGLWIVSNVGRIGYIEAALAGALLGGGVFGMIAGLKTLGRSKGPMEDIIAADAAGITLSTCQGSSRLVPWSDVKSIRPASRGVQKGVAVDVADPNAYFQSLTAKERKQIKDYRNFFSSPCSVRINYVDAAQQEIVGELSRLWQLSKQQA